MVGPTTARGYGAHHQAERRRWATKLNHGQAITCACPGDCGRHTDRCTTAIHAGSNWDLGHTPDRKAWTGPECVPCNRARGAVNSNAPQVITRQWW